MKLGFYIDTLSPSQLSYYLIRNINSYIKNNIKDDIIIFYETVSKPAILPQFSIMQSHEIYSYEGTVVSTSLDLTNKLLNFPGPTNKIFYIWDLEWLRQFNQKHYEEMLSIYRNPKLKLIARSQNHADILKKCWNLTNIDIVSNCNINDIITYSEKK